MKRVFLAAALALGAVPTQANAASRQELAAAPPWVRNLHCRDIITPNLEIKAPHAFRAWFDTMMTELGVSNTDDLYALLLTSCSFKLNQDWGVVDAVMGVREAAQGLRQ